MTKYSIDSTTLSGIADAIRAKGETSDPIAVSNFATSITNLPAGGTFVTKTITENDTYYAEDDDADGYSSVTVNVAVSDEHIFFSNGRFYQTDKYQVTFSETGASYIDIINGNIVVDIENQNEVSGFTVKSIESIPKEYFVVIEVTKTNPSFVGNAMQTGRCSLDADARLCMISGTGRYSYHNIELQNNKTNYLIQNNVYQVNQSGIFICGHFFSISKMWLFTGYSFPYNN